MTPSINVHKILKEEKTFFNFVEKADNSVFQFFEEIDKQLTIIDMKLKKVWEFSYNARKLKIAIRIHPNFYKKMPIELEEKIDSNFFENYIGKDYHWTFHLGRYTDVRNPIAGAQCMRVDYRQKKLDILNPLIKYLNTSDLTRRTLLSSTLSKGAQQLTKILLDHGASLPFALKQELLKRNKKSFTILIEYLDGLENIRPTYCIEKISSNGTWNNLYRSSGNESLSYKLIFKNEEDYPVGNLEWIEEDKQDINIQEASVHKMVVQNWVSQEIHASPILTSEQKSQFLDILKEHGVGSSGLKISLYQKNFGNYSDISFII